MPIPMPIQKTGVYWAVTPTKGILPSVRRFLLGDIWQSLEQLAEDRTWEITIWMQENAPWNDITGDARASLRAELEVIYNEGITIAMTYGPEITYSFWLEVMQGGRFSILAPAWDHFKPVILSDLRKLGLKVT